MYPIGLSVCSLNTDHITIDYNLMLFLHWCFQMLQCIIGMVDKTKRAVSVLQTRCSQDREELLAWARKTAEETEAEVKRRAGLQLILCTCVHAAVECC